MCNKIFLRNKIRVVETRITQTKHYLKKLYDIDGADSEIAGTLFRIHEYRGSLAAYNEILKELQK